MDDLGFLFGGGASRKRPKKAKRSRLPAPKPKPKPRARSKIRPRSKPSRRTPTAPPSWPRRVELPDKVFDKLLEAGAWPGGKLEDKRVWSHGGKRYFPDIVLENLVTALRVRPPKRGENLKGVEVRSDPATKRPLVVEERLEFIRKGGPISK